MKSVRMTFIIEMYFYQEFSQDRINSDFVVYAVTFISVVYAVTFISVVYAVTFISAQLTARTEAKTTTKIKKNN